MPTHLTTSVELDPAAEVRLRRLATERRKPAQELVRDAIAQYLDREERRQQVLQEAAAAWNEYQTTGLHVTAEEADAWLDRLENGEDCEPPQSHR